MSRTLTFDAQARVQQLSALAALEKGQALARNLDRTGATAQFRQAMALDPKLVLDPVAEAYRLVGQAQAALGQVDEATTSLSEARRLDPSLTFDPAVEAQQLALQAAVIRAIRLAGPDQIAPLNEPQLLDPAQATIWDARCRLGSSLTACDRAVRFAPAAAWVYDSRARVRAGQGNFNGATADLLVVRARLEQNPLYHPEWLPIDDWLAALRDKRNPFEPR
jgi:tetratricopeptide (TPR) repeat protein